MKPFAFVAGSAHVDLLARANYDDVIDRPGEVFVEVGGTACNIAANLTVLGVPCRFATAMNSMSFSRIVLDFLKSLNVDVRVTYDDTLPTAAFSAHIDSNGEMYSAITSAPVESHEFTEAYFFEEMRGAACAIIDCNLSTTTVDNAVLTANKLKIPVFVAAVSERKAVRLRSVTGKVAASFLNRQEAQYLRNQYWPDQEYREMATLMNSTLVITRDADGAAVVTENAIENVRPPILDGEGGHRLGMGDAFMAATVKYHVFQGRPLPDAARQAMVFVRELSKRRNCNLGKSGAVEQVLRQLNVQAETDALTGVGNRRASESMGGGAVESAAISAQPLSVIMVDIDRFKLVNDQSGHTAGDEVLANVAMAISAASRDTDHVGRWGGEEFIVVLPNTDEREAFQVGERIRNNVATQKHRSLTDPSLTVTVSAGVASMEPGESFADIVARADSALYWAKETGRNRVVPASAPGVVGPKSSARTA